MIKTRILTTALLFLIASATMFAQEPLEPDAVYHQITKEYTIHEDGSYDLHYFKKLELKTHFAFNRLFGETFVVYNPDYQELIINKAYTIMADGSKTPSPDNAFNEVLPRQARNFPAYNHLKEMVITHTGLEVGATIYLDYTLKTSDEMYGGFSLYEELKKQVPVEEMKIIVNAPEDYELEYTTANLRTGPEIENSDQGKSYTWSFRSLQPNPREGNICSSRKQTLAVLGPKGIRTQVDPAAISYQLPAAASKAVEAQVKDVESDAQKVTNLFSYLRETIDGSPLPQEYVGNTLRTPQQVWSTNVGTTLERTVMLVAMIRKAGVFAEPVMVVDKNALPVLHSNNQLMLSVEMKDTAPLLINVDSRTPENSYYKAAGKELIPLTEGKTERRIQPEKAKNAYQFEGELYMTPDTVYGDGSLMLRYAMNPYLKLVEDESNAEKVLSGMAAHKAEINSISPAVAEIGLKFSADLKPLSEDEFGLKVLEIPSVRGGLEDMGFTLWNDRITSFEIPYLMSGEMKWVIHLEDLECLNNSFQQSHQVTNGKVTVNVEVSSKKVMVSKNVSLEKRCYNPMEYSEIRDMIRLFMKKEVNTLIFREKE